MTQTATTNSGTLADDKQTYYYHFLKSDKFFFGSFFNLADNNLKATFNDFEKRLGIKSANGLVQKVEQYFPDNLLLSEFERRTELLTEYLPIVHKLRKINKESAEPDRSYFRDNLKMLIKAVDHLRNFYTHYYHKSIIFDERLFEFLNGALLNVCFDVKKKRMKSDTNKAFLKKHFEENFINKSKDKIKEAFDEAFSHLKVSNDGKKFSLTKFYQAKLSHKQKFSVKNDLIFDITNSDFVFLSNSGLLFLLSFFLRREEQEQLLSKMEGFKNQNELNFIATRWVFTHKCFKGLKKTIKSSYDKETLLMQMVDELSKCPDVLYKNLSDKQKQEFVVDVNEFYQEAKEQNEENKLVSHTIIRKRYEDKFAYFALRFLDEFANFPTLRFQVVVGNYLQNEQEKQIKNTTTVLKTNRQIKERIKMFGKLSTLSSKKAAYFKAILEDRTLTAEEKGLDPKWEIFPNPSYGFKGNNIPIYINKKGFKNMLSVDEAKVRTNKDRAAKKDIIEKIFGKDNYYGKPIAYLSLNELPALLYEFLVNGKNGADIENIIFNKIKQQVVAIKAADKTNKGIPNKLRKAKEENDYDLNKLKGNIKDQIDECNEKIHFIRTCRAAFDPNKTKHFFTLKQLGDEATWLADDIKRFMLPEARKNWKAYEHSEFQRLLAFYKRFRKDARQLLKNKWTMNDTFGEMVKRCFSQVEFDQFYEMYLIDKIEQLEVYKNQLDGEAIQSHPKLLKKVLKEIFRYFNERLYLIKPAGKQIEELLKHPINLPRGIFDNRPTYIENANHTDHKDQYAAWFLHITKNENELQQFYSFAWNINNDKTLDYEKLTKEKMKRLEKKRKRQGKTNQNFSQNNSINFNNLKEKIKIRLQKDAKAAINKQIRSDVFIKAMADYVFEKTFDKPYQIPLNEIYQNKAQKEQMRNEAAAQQSRAEGDKSSNIYNETFIWNKVISYSIFGGKIKEEKLKLKDIGKFRALEQNPKVKAIVTYPHNDDWSKTEIEKELTNYERIRSETLLKSVQEIEKKVLQKLQTGTVHPKILEHKGNPQFRKYVVEGFLKDMIAEPELTFFNNNKTIDNFSISEVEEQALLIQQAFYLILIRNKFAHNQLPNVAFFEAMINISGIEKRNDNFAAQLNQIFDTFKAEIIK